MKKTLSNSRLKLNAIFLGMGLALVLLGAGCNSGSSYDTTVAPTASQYQMAATTTATQEYQTPPAQTPPPPAIFSQTLSYGSSGTDVASVQQFLTDEGLYSGSDSGYFDQSTVNAVMAFEQQQNIQPANGFFGQAEEAAANSILAQHPDWVTTLSNGTGYSNVNGSPVHSPAYSTNGVPAGATAICGDGTYSFSMHRSGTCSHHGGVSEWLN